LKSWISIKTRILPLTEEKPFQANTPNPDELKNTLSGGSDRDINHNIIVAVFRFTA
jgi:hypothetical protein